MQRLHVELRKCVAAAVCGIQIIPRGTWGYAQEGGVNNSAVSDLSNLNAE